MVLFVSSGEIFIILLFILIFFGADKIPEFTRMMNKGMREFKKASDDIKREFTDNTSGVMSELRSIQNDLTDSLTKEIAEPVQKTVSEAEKTFDEHKEQAEKTFEEYQDPVDYYYQNPDDVGRSGNEYRDEAQSSTSENSVENVADTYGNQVDAGIFEPAAETPKPKSKPRNPKPKTRTAQSSTKLNSKTKTKNPNGAALNEVKPKA